MLISCPYCGVTVQSLRQVRTARVLLVDPDPVANGYLTIDEGNNTWAGVARPGSKERAHGLYQAHAVSCRRQRITSNTIEGDK